jgi:hypothetical protein
MMDGHWSESEFERQMRIVKIQDSYPQLSKVVNLMVPSFDFWQSMGSM